MNDKKILLPRRKWEGPLTNIAGAMLVLLKSDFLQKPLTDASVWPMLGLWIGLFFISITRIYVSSVGLEIYLWNILIRKISAEKISCIEVIDWPGKTPIYFEFGKCPQFNRGDKFDSLWIFFSKNFFRLIEYIPPENKKDEVLVLLNTLFPTKVVAGE